MVEGASLLDLPSIIKEQNGCEGMCFVVLARFIICFMRWRSRRIRTLKTLQTYLHFILFFSQESIKHFMSTTKPSIITTSEQQTVGIFHDDNPLSYGGPDEDPVTWYSMAMTHKGPSHFMMVIIMSQHLQQRYRNGMKFSRFPKQEIDPLKSFTNMGVACTLVPHPCNKCVINHFSVRLHSKSSDI